MATLTSCQLAQTPDPPDFGFRMEGRGLVIAFPICSSESVYGAKITVRVVKDEQGRFDALWSAGGPNSDAVRRGEFVVGNDSSFTTQEKALSGKLPDEFYVEAWLDETGRDTDSGSIDLSKLRSAKLADDEYMTQTGRAMTREEINAQRACGTT